MATLDSVQESRIDSPESRDLTGLVTCVAKFCSNSSTLAAPLRDLTRAEVEWTWGVMDRNALTDQGAL